MQTDAPGEQIIVDEEVQDTGLLPAEDSERSDDTPTDNASTTATATDPDPLSEDGADDEDLEEELATAGKPADPATPAAAAPEKKPATAEPFKYQGDKKEHVLDGAKYYAGDGLYIPEAVVPKIKQMLATAAVHNGSWQRREREYQRAIEEARSSRTEKDVAADALMDLVFKDLGALETDEDVYEWAVNFRAKLPEHRLAIKERQLEHRQKQFESRSQPSPEDREEQLTGLASQELDQTLEEIFRMPEMKVLDAEDQKELRTRFGPLARRLISEAQRDDEHPGVKKGDLVFDGASLLDQIKIAAGIKARAVRSSEAARTAAEANRRKAGAPTPAAARAPGSARSSAPNPDAGQPREERTGRFKSKQEYEEWARSDAE